MVKNRILDFLLNLKSSQYPFPLVSDECISACVYPAEAEKRQTNLVLFVQWRHFFVPDS